MPTLSDIPAAHAVHTLNAATNAHLERIVAAHLGTHFADATLAALTAASIAEVILGGGGARNPGADHARRELRSFAAHDMARGLAP
ncbi:MAG: hypothetical protein K8S97_09170 [Anaerolineae bacterium]|nr:hypothetical protein [Anaerolineae bacterium]